ncbi:MAG: hypothetical protein ACLQVD_10870 [Capsulimonadaceae bacterium]
MTWTGPDGQQSRHSDPLAPSFGTSAGARDPNVNRPATLVPGGPFQFSAPSSHVLAEASGPGWDAPPPAATPPVPAYNPSYRWDSQAGRSSYYTSASSLSVPRPVQYAVAGAVGLAVLIAVLAATGVFRGHAQIPTGFTTYTSIDGSFNSDAPLNWSKSDKSDFTSNDSDDATGKTTGARFSSGDAFVDISSAPVVKSVGGLLGGVFQDLLSHRTDTIQSWAKSPIAAFHNDGKSAVSQSVQRYVEQPAVEEFGGMGDLLVSEWTAQSGGSEVRGYRATTIGGDRTYSIVCECRDSDWPLLRADFHRILMSVAIPGLAPPSKSDDQYTDWSKPQFPTATNHPAFISNVKPSPAVAADTSGGTSLSTPQQEPGVTVMTRPAPAPAAASPVQQPLANGYNGATPSGYAPPAPATSTSVAPVVNSPAGTGAPATDSGSPVSNQAPPSTPMPAQSGVAQPANGAATQPSVNAAPAGQAPPTQQ